MALQIFCSQVSLTLTSTLKLLVRDKEQAKDYKIPAEKSMLPVSAAGYVNYL